MTDKFTGDNDEGKAMTDLVNEILRKKGITPPEQVDPEEVVGIATGELYQELPTTSTKPLIEKML